MEQVGQRCCRLFLHGSFLGQAWAVWSDPVDCPALRRRKGWISPEVLSRPSRKRAGSRQASGQEGKTDSVSLSSRGQLLIVWRFSLAYTWYTSLVCKLLEKWNVPVAICLSPSLMGQRSRDYYKPYEYNTLLSRY